MSQSSPDTSEPRTQENRRLVVCCDGTGNEIAEDSSNVLKFYSVLKQTSTQVVFYDPGVGTMSDAGAWSIWKSKAEGVFGLLTGYGLDANVIDAYRFLVRNWRLGDEIWLFGYSRGAYTARVLASLIRLVGILRPHQEHLIPYALTTYKRADTEHLPELAYRLNETLRTYRPSIRFIGCWDTVGSVIIPRRDRFYLPSIEDLPGVRRNSSVEVFRHALALDERRRMFRPTLWEEPQPFKPNPYLADDHPLVRPQDVKAVWFPGVHGDVGGGYPEAESGAAKRALAWMVEEAREHGIEYRERMVDRLVYGRNPRNAKRTYVGPDAKAELHTSLRGPWWLLEILPRWTSLPWAWKHREGLRQLFPLGDRRQRPADAEIRERTP